MQYIEQFVNNLDNTKSIRKGRIITFKFINKGIIPINKQKKTPHKSKAFKRKTKAKQLHHLNNVQHIIAFIFQRVLYPVNFLEESEHQYK